MMNKNDGSAGLTLLIAVVCVIVWALHQEEIWDSVKSSGSRSIPVVKGNDTCPSSSTREVCYLEGE